MTDDPWHTERLDLDAYLTRIGVPARPPARAALDELHEAHVRTFTFDNIDVLLDQHPGIDLDAVQDKFVRRGRGGYCFEHATLLAAALDRLGYHVERRLGRVGDPTAPRTHCVLVIHDLNDTPLLADPGFGLSLLRPLPLTDGATDDDHAGLAYQLRQVPIGDGHGWALHRWRDGDWELMHTHDELPVHPTDLQIGHHYTSTHPTSHFRHGLMLTRHGDGQHTAITHSTITVRRPGQPTEHRDIDTAELRDLLRHPAVPLTDDEEQRLLDRIAELRAASRP
ncbi:arylamine N-acetyltransferase family protein [Pseudofrankia saprophytica]|uniref:arylamine N-acetyltransferase family protein n=1 Tax=Pseudofrankia saprophytica TaxID=298655 RepID=UPI00031FAD0A|nr:arylamine N-acetyltransferase [Pseudofrankia saprophytica]